MPITCSGRWVIEAIFVIDIEEVLLASMHEEGAKRSSSLNIESFTGKNPSRGR